MPTSQEIAARIVDDALQSFADTRDDEFGRWCKRVHADRNNLTVLWNVKPGVPESVCVCGWGALRGAFLHRTWCAHSPGVRWDTAVSTAAA